MAGDWIKMRSDLHTHPKVVRMASASNADRLRVIGGLHAVWCLFDVHSEDGSLSGYTPQAVDDLIGFPGFAEVMAGVSWLEIHSDGLVLPEFNEHNGQSAKRRATEAKRKRQERENPSQNTVRKMSASDADKKRTREEKRREEIKTIPDGMDGKPSKLTDPDEIIFGYGVPMLVNAGTAEKQARSFLGGLRKHHGDETLIDKLRECIKAKPLQPLEWLAAALPPGGVKPKLNKQEALEASNAAVAERFLRNNGYATQ